MLICFGAENLEPGWDESVVAIGTFDGVHLGHQGLIRKAVEAARVKQCPSIVVTFDRHPAAILAPERCPPSLSSLEQNLHEFKKLGARLTLVLPFDKELSQTSAESFLHEILCSRLRAGQVVIGHDFAFGKGRQGTPEWLAAHLPTTVLAPVEFDGQRISSSTIRALILAGKVEKASALLGRAYRLSGLVVRGQQLGKQLGYPTANLALHIRQAIPGDGVYSGSCQTDFGLYPAAISIGNRPSVGGESRVIEAYLLDYPGNSLYGQAIELSFSQKLRDQEHFGNLEELKAQMKRDVELVAQSQRL